MRIATYDSGPRRHQQEQEARSFSESYPDGKPRTLGRYDGDGARWGVWWFWYPNGQLAREVEYESGVRKHGFREWYEDGHARTDGSYVVGRKDSRWRRWDPSGRLVEDEDVPRRQPDSARCHARRRSRVRVSAVKRSVTVQIAGLRYSLKTDDDDRTVKALAAYVDGKIRDIQRQAKVPDTQAVAVLTALQIAEELFAERRESLELRKRIREKSQSLLDYLEREARV